MKKIISFLEREISEMENLNTQLNAAAASSPFGNSIDLEKAAEAHLRNCEPRIATEIWQKHRIKILKYLLEEINELKTN